MASRRAQTSNVFQHSMPMSRPHLSAASVLRQCCVSGAALLRQVHCDRRISRSPFLAQLTAKTLRNVITAYRVPSDTHEQPVPTVFR